MYSTYEQYRNTGGELSVDQYEAWAERAASLIDCRTLHRAASAPAAMRHSLGLAECELIDILLRGKKAESGLASENIEGYSYTVKTDAEAAQGRAINEVLRRYLFRPDLGVNLLCRGLNA